MNQLTTKLFPDKSSLYRLFQIKRTEFKSLLWKMNNDKMIA